MIENLKTKGIKVGIITDGRPEGQRNKIEALGLDIDDVIITDELGGTQFRKPCDIAFRILMTRWRLHPADIIYTQGASDWKFDVGVVGFSANNAYLQNSVWAPQVSFQVNGEDYSFLLYMNLEDGVTLNHYTSLMYDTMKDMWSGATPVYKFELINQKTEEHWKKFFATPINMTFQTTGRKK